MPDPILMHLVSYWRPGSGPAQPRGLLSPCPLGLTHYSTDSLLTEDSLTPIESEIDDLETAVSGAESAAEQAARDAQTAYNKANSVNTWAETVWMYYRLNPERSAQQSARYVELNFGGAHEWTEIPDSNYSSVSMTPWDSSSKFSLAAWKEEMHFNVPPKSTQLYSASELDTNVLTINLGLPTHGSAESFTPTRKFTTGRFVDDMSIVMSNMALTNWEADLKTKVPVGRNLTVNLARRYATGDPSVTYHTQVSGNIFSPMLEVRNDGAVLTGLFVGNAWEYDTAASGDVAELRQIAIGSTLKGEFKLDGGTTVSTVTQRPIIRPSI